MLSMDTVSFAYGQVPVLSGISMHCEAGEIVAIVGRSGVGKTTLLNLIAGYISPDIGSVKINGASPTEAKVPSGSIGFVFQQPTLIPWLTTEKNVRLPLELQRRKAKNPVQMQDLSYEAMKRARIEHAASLYPFELSGGMQTRAAIARALVTSPTLFLLDEPFSSLDDMVKEELYTDLQNGLRDTKTASILVTHDLSEAIRLSDRVYVLAADETGVGSISLCETISLEKPRGPDVFLSPELHQSRKAIMGALA